MTLERREDRTPQPLDEGTSPRDERPKNLVGLVAHSLSEWSMTFRLATLLLVCAGVMVLAMWLLPIDVIVGPIQIIKH